MKKLLIVLCILLFAVPVMAGDETFFTNDASAIKFYEAQPLNVVFTGDGHQMTWKPDGTVEIDGKVLDRLSDPEIKEAIKSIAAVIINQSGRDSLLEQFSRQTDYLLEELEKCQRACGK